MTSVPSDCLQGGYSPGQDKTEGILHRVEELLREILETSNHGEITIRVVAGRIKVSGGPEIEFK